MRIGLIGVGRIGAFHARTLRGLPGVESVVVADTDADRAREVAGRLGAEAAGSAAELLDAGIDALAVASSTSSHPELIMAGVRAGLPVFCEKPVACDIAGTVEVIKAVSGIGSGGGNDGGRTSGDRDGSGKTSGGSGSETSGSNSGRTSGDRDGSLKTSGSETSSSNNSNSNGGDRVQIGFQRRFDAGFRAAREAVRSGELGRVHTIRSTTCDVAPPPAGYIKTSGGIFRDCAVHDFDAIRWVTGREVVSVYAAGANRGEPFFADADDVDTALVTLTLDDGTLAAVSCARYNAGGYDVRLELLGSGGSVCAGLDENMPLRPAMPGKFPRRRPPRDFMDRFRDAYAAELAAFTRLAAGGGPSPCTLADALEAFYIAEACELSRRRSAPVGLAEVRR